MVRASNLRTRQLFWASFVCAGLHLVFGQQYRGLISTKNGIYTYAFYFDLEITNRNFNSSLLDPTSEYYKSLKSEVNTLMDAIYKCSGCTPENSYQGTKDMTFKAGKSIIAEMSVIFEFHDTSVFINSAIILYTFKNTVDEKETPDGIKVNKEYTNRDNVQPVTTGPTTTTPTTTTQLTSTTTTLPTTTSTTPTTTTTTPTTPTTTTTTPTPTTTTPSTTPATTSGSTRVKDDATTTDHSASASASATPQQNTTGTALTTDIDHLNSNSTAASVTPRHLIESTNTTTATTTGYPLVPYWFDWVPGWAIALLVLASLILLLLIILIILLLVRWCCLDEPEDQPIKSGRPDPYHSPYLSHSSARTPILNMTNQPMTPEKPKEGRAGMYVVNP